MASCKRSSSARGHGLRLRAAVYYCGYLFDDVELESGDVTVGERLFTTLSVAHESIPEGWRLLSWRHGRGVLRIPPGMQGRARIAGVDETLASLRDDARALGSSEVSVALGAGDWGLIEAGEATIVFHVLGARQVATQRGSLGAIFPGAGAGVVAALGLSVAVQVLALLVVLWPDEAASQAPREVTVVAEAYRPLHFQTSDVAEAVEWERSGEAMDGEPAGAVLDVLQEMLPRFPKVDVIEMDEDRLVLDSEP